MGRGTPIVAAVLALAMAPAAQAADHDVTFPSGAAPAPYSPSSLQIARGDTVTFRGSFSAHPLVWDAGQPAPTSTGTEATFPFNTGGTFSYHCQIHPMSMTGSVTVSANRLGTADFTAAPAAPRAGDTVTFTATGSDPDGSITRFEWDLDGDGTFEAQGAAVSRAYATAGTVKVSVRYVDDANETSPATSHELMVAPAPTAGGSAGGGSTGGGSTGGGTPGGVGGTTPGAPTARLLTTRLRLSGGAVALRLDLDEAASVRATLRVGRRTLARTERALRLRAGPRVQLRVPLTRAGRAALRRASSVRATLVLALRDAGGNRRTLARTVTLRR